MQELEKLETARKAIEESMALPEAYSNGAHMRELRTQHDDNAGEHARAIARWEQVDARIGELKERLAALRSDRAVQ